MRRKLLLTVVSGMLALSFVPAQAAPESRVGTIQNGSVPLGTAQTGADWLRDNCVRSLQNGGPSGFQQKCEKSIVSRHARCYYALTMSDGTTKDLPFPDAQSGSLANPGTGIFASVTSIKSKWIGFPFTLSNTSGDPQNTAADFDVTFWNDLGDAAGACSGVGTVGAAGVEVEIFNNGTQDPEGCIGKYTYAALGNESGTVPCGAGYAVIVCLACVNASWELKVTGL